MGLYHFVILLIGVILLFRSCLQAFKLGSIRKVKVFMLAVMGVMLIGLSIFLFSPGSSDVITDIFRYILNSSLPLKGAILKDESVLIFYFRINIWNEKLIKKHNKMRCSLMRKFLTLAFIVVFLISPYKIGAADNVHEAVAKIHNENITLYAKKKDEFYQDFKIDFKDRYTLSLFGSTFLTLPTHRSYIMKTSIKMIRKN